MGIADGLIGMALKMAEQSSHRTSQLQREISDLEALLQKKEAAHYLARTAANRASNFVPMQGVDFYCPSCWVEKEKRAVLRTIPLDILKCDSCGRDFDVLKCLGPGIHGAQARRR
jgi:hypothetical protein